MGWATDVVYILETVSPSTNLEEFVELHAPIWKGVVKCVARERPKDTHFRRGPESERNGTPPATAVVKAAETASTVVAPVQIEVGAKIVALVEGKSNSAMV